MFGVHAPDLQAAIAVQHIHGCVRLCQGHAQPVPSPERGDRQAPGTGRRQRAERPPAVRDRHERSKELRGQAETRLQDGVSTPGAWAQWEAALALRHEAELLELESQQQYRAAAAVAVAFGQNFQKLS